MTFRRKRVAGLVVATATVTALVAPLWPSVAFAQDNIQCRASAPVFVARENGDLALFQHEEPEAGVGNWSYNGNIGSDWVQTRVIGGPDGRVYSLRSDGELRRFRWNGSGWDGIGGGQYEVMATEGWDRYVTPDYTNRVTIDENGHFYTVEPDGNLHFRIYNESTKIWTHRVIDTGWDQYDLIVAAGNGVIWARAPHGDFYRFRYHADSQRWLQYQQHLDVGWNSFSTVFSAGADVFYAIRPDTGELFWYRYLEATNTWVSDVGTLIGTDWNNQASVFSDPSACKLISNPFPQRPTVTAKDFTPTAIAEGSSGLLQYFYADTFGRIVHGRQRSASDVTIVDYGTVGDKLVADTPAGAVDGNGNIYVNGLGRDDSATRRATFPAGTVAWTPLTDIGGWTPNPAALIPDANKTVTALVVDATGKLWTHNQNLTNTLGWRPTTVTGLTGDIVTARAGDASEIVVKTTTGELKASRYANGTFGPWRSLGSHPGTGKISFAVNPNNTLQLFARQANGAVVTGREVADGSPTWTALPAIDPAVTASGSPNVGVANGTIHITVRGTDNFVYVTEQAAPGSPTYRPWRKLADSRTGASYQTATDPTAIGTSAGRIVVTFRGIDDTSYIYQTVTPPPARDNNTPPDYHGGPAGKAAR